METKLVWLHKSALHERSQNVWGNVKMSQLLEPLIDTMYANASTAEPDLSLGPLRACDVTLDLFAAQKGAIQRVVKRVAVCDLNFFKYKLCVWPEKNIRLSFHPYSSVSRRKMMANAIAMIQQRPDDLWGDWDSAMRCVSQTSLFGPSDEPFLCDMLRLRQQHVQCASRSVKFYTEDLVGWHVFYSLVWNAVGKLRASQDFERAVNVLWFVYSWFTCFALQTSFGFCKTTDRDQFQKQILESCCRLATQDNKKPSSMDTMIARVKSVMKDENWAQQSSSMAQNMPANTELIAILPHEPAVPLNDAEQTHVSKDSDHGFPGADNADDTDSTDDTDNADDTSAQTTAPVASDTDGSGTQTSVPIMPDTDGSDADTSVPITPVDTSELPVLSDTLPEAGTYEAWSNDGKSSTQSDLGNTYADSKPLDGDWSTRDPSDSGRSDTAKGAPAADVTAYPPANVGLPPPQVVQQEPGDTYADSKPLNGEWSSGERSTSGQSDSVGATGTLNADATTYPSADAGLPPAQGTQDENTYANSKPLNDRWTTEPRSDESLVSAVDSTLARDDESMVAQHATSVQVGSNERFSRIPLANRLRMPTYAVPDDKVAPLDLQNREADEEDSMSSTTSLLTGGASRARGKERTWTLNTAMFAVTAAVAVLGSW